VTDAGANATAAVVLDVAGSLGPLPPPPTPQVEPVGKTEVPLSEADYNRNFIVQSLQGFISPNCYDLDEFNDKAIVIIARAVTHAQDRVILARVLRSYEIKRRESIIVNPSAFIVGTLRRELHRELPVKDPRGGSTSGQQLSQPRNFFDERQPAQSETPGKLCALVLEVC